MLSQEVCLNCWRSRKVFKNWMIDEDEDPEAFVLKQWSEMKHAPCMVVNTDGSRKGEGHIECPPPEFCPFELEHVMANQHVE